MVLFVFIFGACLLYLVFLIQYVRPGAHSTFLIIFGVKRFVFGIKFILLDSFLSVVQCLFCCILCLIIKFSTLFPRAVFFLGPSSKTRETRK